MTRTLQVIEERVNEAMDHLTAALEPLDWRDRPLHVWAAAHCFYYCYLALMSEYAWSRAEQEERRR
jgi:hypothetical protein